MAGERLLIVEDENLLRDLLAELMAEAGFEVYAVATGLAALDRIDGPGPLDVLLADIDLRGPLTGVDVARHWRARRGRRPVIFASALSPEVANPGPLGPGDVFLRKPYRSAAVLGAVRSACAGPRRPAEMAHG